jgi:putative endonuclease
VAEHNEIGKRGEKLAANYLGRNGYQLVAMNWHYKKLEIDIIAYDQDVLVIVEVKLRSTDYFGDPSEAVTIKKQKYLVEAAEAYLNTIKAAPVVRFDVISIIASTKEYQFEHITDAFTPGW